jgi:formylglycine-generating enzyme required for sulfatase activity
MTEPTQEELLAQIAELQSKLAAQTQEGKIAAAGDRSIIAAGDVYDNVIITGDQAVYYGTVETLHVASAIFQAPPLPGQVEPKQLLWTYLNQVVADTATLDLSGLDRRAVSDQEQAHLQLAAIYTALDVRYTSSEPVDDFEDAIATAPNQRQSVLAFVNEVQYAALLGEAGSGKTTFVNYLALSLAGELLGLPQVNLARLGAAWTAGPLLPVRIVLRHFAIQMDSPQPHPQHISDNPLWTYITGQIGQSLSEFAPLLRQHLLEEGGLLILDGLDEVPEAQQRREWVKQAVLDFRRQFPRVRILLTSRLYAYQRQQWRLPDFDEALLAPFDKTQIEIFIKNWYAHLAHVRQNLSKIEGQGRALRLKQVIDRNPHLHELASRPLLLTLIASLHAWRGGNLPEAREQLYEESVELLIDLWERPKMVLGSDGRPLLQVESIAEWLQAPQVELRKTLEKLAFTVHRDQAEQAGSADIQESQLVTALHKVANPDTKSIRIIEYIRDRAGLLINRGEGIYSFPHRTFQEYLAARYLTQTNFPKYLVELVRSEPERWREVLLLAGARVARSTPYAAWSLLSRLCPQPCDPERAQNATVDDWLVALLTGQILAETGIDKAETLDLVERQICDTVLTWLLHLVASNRLLPTERTKAGIVLGILGDARPGVGLGKEGLPDIAWLKIEAGSFLIGSEPSAWDRLQQPYSISRYPITVTQYGAFTAAGGYERQDYWTEAGWLWRESEQVSTPQTYAHVFQTPNHPQVGVSWYEAVAFCHWLSAQLGEPVMLPSEPQWERAARHDDGRIYPWGNEFDPHCCNMRDTNIGHTSAVGIFPAGNALSGAADMCGNVWEWCRTQWHSHYTDYPSALDDLEPVERRVLRGGSFSNPRKLVRCAQRHRDYPTYRSFNIGFRIITV